MIRPNDNLIYILQNDASSWGAGAVLGSSVTLENAVCSAWVGGSGKEVWHQSDGWYERGYASLTFKAGFTGSNPGWAGIYAYSGNSNSTSGWVTTGTWTVPNMQTTGTGARMTYEAVNHPVNTNDMLSGGPMLMPSSYNPDTAINLSTASEDNPMTIPLNTPFSASIRYAKPNTQVWATYTILQHAPYPEPNDVFQFVVLPNGGLIGTTDSTGYFLYNSSVQPVGGNHNISFYVVNSASNPVTPANYDSNPALEFYAGSVAFFASGQANQPPPTYYSMRKGSKSLVQGKRADNFNVGRATSTWQKVGETWNYALTLDTTKADLIRVSRMSGWEGEIGPDNLNFRRQNGWQGSQGWTHDDPSGARGPATKFELISEWMPGPVSLYFVTDDTAEPFVMQDTEQEDRALADAGGIFHNSVRRHVIGPAIPPDIDMKGLSALIRNWVDEGNHFLKPLVGIDIDLRAAISSLTGMKDGYETNVVDCIKAALEVAK